MDPNEALRAARVALGAYRAIQDANDSPVDTTEMRAADKLADAFEALDIWLTRGGFLPKSWEE